MQLLVQLLTIEELGEQLLNLGDTCRAAYEDDFINTLLCQIGIGKSLWEWLHAALEDRFQERLKLGSREIHRIVIVFC